MAKKRNVRATDRRSDLRWARVADWTDRNHEDDPTPLEVAHPEILRNRISRNH